MSQIAIDSLVKSKNKQGSMQGVGIVVAMQRADYFLSQVKNSPLHMWSKNFPNWQQMPVVLVYFEKPQRSATIDEWVASGLQTTSKTSQELMEEYESNCHFVQLAAFPIEDLELVSS